MSDQLRAMLIRHEGLRLKPYADTVGKMTIGVGRNLTDDGITETEAYFLLDGDIVDHTRDAQLLPMFAALDPVRQDVLVSLVFNLGLPRLKGFVKFLAALSDQNWEGAAGELLDSKWAAQVGNRSQELAAMIRTGEYQTGVI